MTDSYDLAFVWPYSQASDVIVTGTFDQWRRSIRLKKTLKGFEGHVSTPWNTKVLYKFIVDGRWSTLDGKPTEIDPIGNINNVIFTPMKPAPAPVSRPVENKTKAAAKGTPPAPTPASAVPLNVQPEVPVIQGSTPDEGKEVVKISHADNGNEDDAFHTAHGESEASHELPIAKVEGDSLPPAKVVCQPSPARATSAKAQDSADRHAQPLSPDVITQTTTKPPQDAKASSTTIALPSRDLKSAGKEQEEANHAERVEAKREDQKLASGNGDIRHGDVAPKDASPKDVSPKESTTKQNAESDVKALNTQPPRDLKCAGKEQEEANHAERVEAKREDQKPASGNGDIRHGDFAPKDIVPKDSVPKEPTTKQNAESVSSPTRTDSSHVPTSTGRASDVTVVEKESHGPLSKHIARKNSRIRIFLERLESLLHLKKGKKRSSKIGGTSEHAK